MILIMGLLYSTVFYDFKPTDVSVVIGVLFSSILFLSMGQSSQVPTYIAERDISTSSVKQFFSAPKRTCSRCQPARFH